MQRLGMHGSQDGIACLPAAAFRQGGCLVSRHRERKKDNRPVVADRPRKSSGSETTFERDLTTPTEIVAGIEAMADEVWAWCEKANAFGRTVAVKVNFADFRLVTRSRSFSSVIARHDLLRQASLELAAHAASRQPWPSGCSGSPVLEFRPGAERGRRCAAAV